MGDDAPVNSSQLSFEERITTCSNLFCRVYEPLTSKCVGYDKVITRSLKPTEAS